MNKGAAGALWLHTRRRHTNARLWVKYASCFMRFGVSPGARWWHRPSWRMWQSRSAGAQAGILTEPGVLSQWVERHPGFRKHNSSCMSTTSLQLRLWKPPKKVDFQAEIFSREKNIDLVASTINISPFCCMWDSQRFMPLVEKKTFSNQKGWSNKRPACLKELNVLFLWGLCKPFIKVKQSCQTPVVPAWGYLPPDCVSTL